MFLLLLLNVLLWRKLKNHISIEDPYDHLILPSVFVDQMISLNLFLFDPEHCC